MSTLLTRSNCFRTVVQQVMGLVLMVVGVVVALVTYTRSLNQDDVRDVISSGTLVVAMVVLTLLGAALFISATVTSFLRRFEKLSGGRGRRR
jgi:membrane-anchored glycerophosphoryl diester phosphodiesterase (GDPDase)